MLVLSEPVLELYKTSKETEELFLTFNNLVNKETDRLEKNKCKHMLKMQNRAFVVTVARPVLFCMAFIWSQS